MHANGASMFFIVVYIHTFRGLFFGSYLYPRQLLWIVGALILLLMIMTAFMGYVLPWGQMSFWGATVITNLFSAIPVIGNDIVLWLWGGFAIDNATLNRFFSFHYLLPFIITALVIIHILLLHDFKSNNPLGLSIIFDNLSFSPYYLIKDLFGVILFLFFFSIFIFFFPNLLGHPDNYIMANPLVTPPHIVPEWYFLPFYAILRSIPNKLFGVLALFAAIVTLIFLPLFHLSEIRSNLFKPASRFLFWFFLMNCFILGWIGSQPVHQPYVFIGQFATIFYFAYFFIALPFLSFFEQFFWTNDIYMEKQITNNKDLL